MEYTFNLNATITATSSKTGNQSKMHPLPLSLPEQTPVHIGSTAAGIREFVTLELQKPQPSTHMLFTNVPPVLMNASLNNPSIFGSKKVRIFYDEDLQQLIVKLPFNPHECAERHLTYEIGKTTDSMGLKRQLKQLGAGRVSNDGVSKEPDSSFKPVTLPQGRAEKWPSVIIECGYSESLNHLKTMAHLWFGQSAGDVKVVILISIEKKTRMITIEKWVPDTTMPNRDILSLRHHTVSGISQQVITIRRNQDGSLNVNGGPLIILFTEMFLRNRVPPNEHDYVVSASVLGEIAELVWSEMN